MFALAMYRIAQPFKSESRVGAIIDSTRLIDLRVAIQHYREQAFDDAQAAEIAAVRAPSSMKHFVAGGTCCFREGQAAIAGAISVDTPDTIVLRGGRSRLAFALDEVELVCPISPGKIVSAGRNYAAHQAESSMPPADDFPRGFIRVGSSVTGPGPIPYPSATRQLDYEVELAVIIGRNGRDNPAAIYQGPDESGYFATCQRAATPSIEHS